MADNKAVSVVNRMLMMTLQRFFFSWLIVRPLSNSPVGGELAYADEGDFVKMLILLLQ